MAANPFDLTGRVALVTGSSLGIGFALAKGLAQAGAQVVINGRNADRLREAAEALQAEGLAVRQSAFDVTDAAAIEDAIGRIETDVGPIAILINNAGIQRRTPLEEFPAETWREIVRANLDSVFLVGQAVARRMIPRRSGSIINIGSVQSELARFGIAPYTATKGAVKMLTKGMATDWGRHGIRVNGIGPGYFATPLNAALVADETFSAWLCNRTPLGRWGEVGELAGAAVFLASDAASFISGHILYVDGGITACL
ncbi:MAG: SDR family oxidoreductase [Acetobacteraceae bacterium]|nr:SDR family oxidoreductase [Acetobacteraceae bacterium]